MRVHGSVFEARASRWGKQFCLVFLDLSAWPAQQIWTITYHSRRPIGTNTYKISPTQNVRFKKVSNHMDHINVFGSSSQRSTKKIFHDPCAGHSECVRAVVTSWQHPVTHLEVNWKQKSWKRYCWSELDFNIAGHFDNSALNSVIKKGSLSQLVARSVVQNYFNTIPEACFHRCFCNGISFFHLAMRSAIA